MDDNFDMVDYDYREDIAIDPQMLDEEWLRQPGLYMQYAEALATIQRMRDKAKERFEVVRSKVEKDIRSHPGKYGLEKVTESAISAEIIFVMDDPDNELNEAKENLDELNYKVSLLQGTLRSFEHKKKALENLVQLWIANYFSGPKEPHDLKEGKRIADVARDKVADKQRRKLNEERTTTRRKRKK